MGELSKEDAERTRDGFVEFFEGCKKDVKDNFDEMDFDNADKKTKMKEYIVNMEKKYDSIITELNNMSFE